MGRIQDLNLDVNVSLLQPEHRPNITSIFQQYANKSMLYTDGSKSVDRVGNAVSTDSMVLIKRYCLLFEHY